MVAVVDVDDDDDDDDDDDSDDGDEFAKVHPTNPTNDKNFSKEEQQAMDPCQQVHHRFLSLPFLFVCLVIFIFSPFFLFLLSFLNLPYSLK